MGSDLREHLEKEIRASGELEPDDQIKMIVIMPVGKYGRLSDTAEAYCVCAIDNEHGGSIIYARYDKGWVINPSYQRSLITELIEMLNSQQQSWLEIERTYTACLRSLLSGAQRRGSSNSYARNIEELIRGAFRAVERVKEREGIK